MRNLKELYIGGWSVVSQSNQNNIKTKQKIMMRIRQYILQCKFSSSFAITKQKSLTANRDENCTAKKKLDNSRKTK